MKYDFGIITDMGGKVGSGHFYRCLAISQELIKHKKKVIFLIKNKKDFVAQLHKTKFPYYVINRKSDLKWANYCENFLSNVEVVIIDMPSQNEMYSKIFHKKSKTVVIDDVGGKTLYADIVFNGQIVNKFHKYQNKNKTTKFFLGPKFMILRNDFKKIKKLSFPKQKTIKKILLTFGGSDEENIAKSISSFFVEKNFFVTIIAGSSHPYKKLVNEFRNYSHINIKTSIPNMASLFAKQDIVISSSGITSYELANLGIPCILIPLDQFQNEIAKALMKKGFGINYGFWDNDFQRLEKTILNLEDYEKRKKMIENGKKIVDNKGLSRVVENLLNL